ncbi:methyltransferase [Plasmodium brasilianum]|uniref:Methyltransferase, putative n=2 Tax=Plasmodium (Plasmodium) TaxID=418103 RepID=A0A1D3PCT2_PLAMA|nr:methyltransferase, putative [Plasmodium malariae]KAI4838539.1 methyltransferase [Plasmodium brasilianum]SCN12942.1 methyltransferase, putative [Plasmodium malariae]
MGVVVECEKEVNKMKGVIGKDPQYESQKGALNVPVNIAEDLLYCVRTNDIDEIKNILQNENINSINNIKDESNNTLVHFACANNNIDMIKFLLYECGSNYNEYNNSGNSPLLWAIQNKHYAAVQELLLFDYYLNKDKYLSTEKRKNEFYENLMNKHLINHRILKENYRLNVETKKKIHSLNVFSSIFNERNGTNTQKGKEVGIDAGAESGVGVDVGAAEWYSEQQREQLCLYKERNKIDLLTKNAFDKHILSEAFNAQDENILQLILNHPISSVLDNPQSYDLKEEVDSCMNKNEKRETDNLNYTKNESSISTSLFEDNQTQIHDSNDDEYLYKRMNGKDNTLSNVCVSTYGINKTKVMEKEIKNSILYNGFTTKHEEAKIVQEYIYELQINEKIKLNNKNIIIKIREIGLNYYGDLLNSPIASSDITGINIWECSIITSKWLYDLYEENNLFANKNILEVGAGCGLVSISLFIYAGLKNVRGVYSKANTDSSSISADRNASIDSSSPNKLLISDVNDFTLRNISYNVDINAPLLNEVDPNWKSKIKVCNIDWTNEDTYVRENNKILMYDFIIGSDLIYDKTMVPSLVYLLNKTLKKQGIFFYVCKKNRDGIKSFLDELQNNNFKLNFFTPPNSYFTNPFLNLNQNLFEAKFTEFEDSHEFIMMRCERL